MIELFKAFPYDNNYDYTKMFPSKIEQINYFNSLNSIVIEDNNYIKVENSFNVNYDYDYLENEGINYLLFNNGYRDIFAFIVKKEYVRKEVTRIIYEVDVIQTFMFDFTLDKSFIERKVCTINEITEFDEGLNIGEHTIVSDTQAFHKNSMFFAMFSGIKNFEVTLDTEGKIIHYAEVPSNNLAPSTNIEGVDYPLLFIPLSNGFIPSELKDHPSLVGVVRFPSCSYTTRQIKIPTLQKIINIETGKTEYTSLDILTTVASSISSVGLEMGSGGSVAKSEVTDFFPYTYYVLTDGEGTPLVMKPQELPSFINVVGQYALSHQPIERYYVEGYKGDYTGRTYNITNANQMMLPTGTSEGMSYISANGGSLKMQRDNQVWNNVLGGVALVGGVIATGGMSLAINDGSSLTNGINKIREGDQRTQDKMLTPNSISSFGTPSTRVAFNTDSIRVLKYTVSDIVKNKIRNYIERYGNKFNNYANIDLKTYNGFIKFISPKINSKIDNIYINKIISILERGVFIE